MRIFSAFLLAALITGCSSPETSQAPGSAPDPNRLEAASGEVKAAVSEIATHVSDNPESILKTVDQTLRNLNQYLEKRPGYLRMDVLSLASKCIVTMEKNNAFMDEYRKKGTRPSFSVVAYCIPVEAVDKSASIPAPSQRSEPDILADQLFDRLDKIVATEAGESEDRANVKAAIELIERGANVNARDSDGATLLTRATNNGHVSIFRKLLDKGADVNAQDGSGRTALMIAAGTNDVAMVRLLLAKKAKLNIQDNSGFTALSGSETPGSTELAYFQIRKLLRSAGATGPRDTPIEKPEIIEKILHADNVTNVPVAVSQEAYYEIFDAVWDKDFKKQMSMIYGSKKVMMIPNDSPVVVLEPNGYITKVRIVKSKRIGWVKSTMLQ